MTEYDVIIVGGGPAGTSCAISLAKKAKKILLLEARKKNTGKVCGDGLTVRAIKTLDGLGINPTVLDGRKAYRKVVFKDNEVTEVKYSELFDFDFEYGVSRDLLDEYMLKRAKECGADVIMGYKVTSIKAHNNKYIINDIFTGKKIILACGALGGEKLGGVKRPNDVPIGISARIISDCKYKDDAFYYFYDDIYGNGYAWLFPVGKQKWNIGVWSSNRKDIKRLYKIFENRIFAHEYEYERMPKGALIGATELKINEEEKHICIGDCAYHADYSTGEGISIAIEDGVKAAEKIMGYI